MLRNGWFAKVRENLSPRNLQLIDSLKLVTSKIKPFNVFFKGFDQPQRLIRGSHFQNLCLQRQFFKNFTQKARYWSQNASLWINFGKKFLRKGLAAKNVPEGRFLDKNMFLTLLITGYLKLVQSRGETKQPPLFFRKLYVVLSFSG